MTHVTTTLWTCAPAGCLMPATVSSAPQRSFVNGTEVEDMAKDAEVARVVAEVNAEMQWLGQA